MSNKSELRHWEIATGGQYGSRFLDAVSATATATGLQCVAINVREASVFSVLSGYIATTATDFRVDNNLTGYTIEPGMVFAPYNGYFTDIAITSGSISYYDKRND